MEQQQIIYIALSCFVLGFSIWIILLKNFLINWIKVKFSGGTKILTKIVNIQGDYYTTSVYNKQHLALISRARSDNKEPRRLIWVDPTQEGNAFYRSFGVTCVDIDDSKDSVYFRFDKEYVNVPPVNTEYYDELVKTALAKPSEEGIGFFNAKTWQIMIIIGMLICIGLAFFVYKDVKAVKEQQVLLHDEHVTIAYEINQTRADLVKLVPFINNMDNTGILVKK